MDIGRAFTYMFDDEHWLKKIGLGGLINLVPILNLAVLGYSIRTLRSAREGREIPLPEWDDWGNDFIRGLLIAIGLFIYSLPALIAFLFGVIIAGGYENQACSLGGFCPGGLWALLVALITPALYLQYAKHDSFASLFYFKEIWRTVSANFGNYLVAALMCLVANIVAAVIGSAALLIGNAWTSFWAYLVQAHLMAQVDPTIASPQASVAS